MSKNKENKKVSKEETKALLEESVEKEEKEESDTFLEAQEEGQAQTQREPLYTEDERDSNLERKKYAVEARPATFDSLKKAQEQVEGQKSPTAQREKPVHHGSYESVVGEVDEKDVDVELIAEKAYEATRLLEPELKPWKEASGAEKKAAIKKVKAILAGKGEESDEYKEAQKEIASKRGLIPKKAGNEETGATEEEESGDSFFDRLPALFSTQEEVFAAIVKLLIWGVTTLLKK